MPIFEYSNLHPKLILFGEYTVLMGGQALTLPLKEYVSRLEFIDQALDIEAAIESNQHLKRFSTYLESEKQLADALDVKSLLQDISDGLYLYSNVPYGYGLGSSGLVCANLYKTYSKKNKSISAEEMDLPALKNYFSLMESFFHKKSSGIDPLACYLSKPLLINNTEIQVIPHPLFEDGKWFLLDSGIARNTEKFVSIFKDYLSNNIYRQELEYHYLPFVNEMIARILHSASNKLDDWTTTRPTRTLIESISILQLKYFRAMVPEFILPFWQYGIDTSLFYIKLLGAGGGGYFLGFTNDFEQVREISSVYKLRIKLLEI
jgi:mevalonate kinase